MFTKESSLIRFLMAVILTSVIFVSLYGDCDMMAMIARDGDYISWKSAKYDNPEDPLDDFNDPYDYFNYIRDRSTNSSPTIPYVNMVKNNDDGYGFIYYPEDGSFDASTQTWYQTDPDQNSNTYYTGGLPAWKTALDLAENYIMTNSSEASIVLGHARQGSVGEGSHPFHCDYVDPTTGEVTTFTFMHNGTLTNDIKVPIYEFLDEHGFLDEYPSMWDVNNNYNSISQWIDSELMFRYLLYFIINDNYCDVVAGIHDALTKTSLQNVSVNSNIKGFLENPTQYDNYTYRRIANFVLSDGKNLYIFRNAPSVGNIFPLNDPHHNLSYEERYNVIAVKTLADLDTKIHQFDFVVISKFGDPFEFADFLDISHTAFIASDITSNNTWSEDKYICSDTEVSNNAEVTITNNAIIKIIANSNFTITDATVNVGNNTQLNLYNSSVVTIDTDGILYLDWGCTLVGTTPTTWEAVEPGQAAGAEHAIPGDRVIAQNGGIVTTGDQNAFEFHPGYPNNVPLASIESSSDYKWDGIMIKNPDNNDDNWFINCSISGIQKLSIENVSESPNSANLLLVQTDFTNSGQILVRDGHTLSIQGTENNPCLIQENSAYPICAYESTVILEDVWVGGLIEGDELENSGGIYLYDSSANNSSITNCNFMYNTGDGLRINGTVLEHFSNNDIVENSGFGMLCYTGTLFLNDDFSDITISNNGYAEYAGWQFTYEMDEINANIEITDDDCSDPNNTGSDGYLLMDILWDGIHPVDIGGTNITYGDLDELYPSNVQAWDFLIDPEEEYLLLLTAEGDIFDGNYSEAEETFKKLILDYPISQEAGIAVYYLYHLENITDQDFAGLIEYLENVSYTEGTPLEMAIKKIITKCFMKDKDYLTAIARLEEIIANSEMPDEVISALIDEGYCYLKLAEENERALPENCTIKTSTLDEYQAKVNELEAQYSFYMGKDQNNMVQENVNILSFSNYPNPFNPITSINFELAEDSDVVISVYNLKGQEVKKLTEENFTSGPHSVTWNGDDNNRKSVASGVYFYKVTAGNSVSVNKMLMLK
ncbi:MAG: T9SS type A sorting domain-containing protein [Candidatus Cloacimonetes bacterium]|nr:T9SS type A sorting domain-containing protein [Candidatus Cloacimonadota bacterium]